MHHCGMPSDNPRLVTRVTPEFRREFLAALDKLNASTGAGLSEAQLVQMSVKFFLQQIEKNGITIGGSKTVPFPGTQPPPAPVGMVAEDPAPYGVPAPAHLQNPVQPGRRGGAAKRA